MGKDVTGYSAPAVGDADYYVLGRFTDCDFYWRGLGQGGGGIVFYYGLEGVPEEFADYVFEV